MARRINTPPAAPQEDDFDELPDTELDQQLLGDLAILSGTEFQDVDWYIYRLKNKAERNENPGGSPRELVARKVGGIDLLEIAIEIGGGDFVFFPVYDAGDGRGRRLQRQQRHSLAGQRKNFNAPTPAAVAAAVVAGAPATDQLSRSERMILKLLRDTRSRLERIERTPPPPPPGNSIKELAETMVMLDGMRARNEPAPSTAVNPDIEVVKVYASVLEKGIQIGEGREPTDENGNKTDWGKLIAQGLEALNNLSAAGRVRRGAPPPQGARPVSEAQEVPTGQAPLTETELRWIVLLGAMERAIAEDQDPGAVATSLEVNLPSVELAELKRDPQAVLARLLPIIDARYPSLKSDASRNYVGKVIAELLADSPGVEVVQ